MKRFVCCLIVAILLYGFVINAAFAESSGCPHEYKYVTGIRYTYVQSDTGHYKHTNNIWHCPQCNIDMLEIIESTYEGHIWTYIDQHHDIGDKFHHVEYRCWPCLKMQTVDFLCDGPPCEIRYYCVTIDPEIY